MPYPHPLLLGHRGASRYARENTVEAFNLALAHGCDEFSLPCADEVIRNFAGRAFLDIELKVCGEVGAILNELRSANRKRFVISSFLPDVLRGVHASAADTPLGIICENARQLRHWPSLPIGTVIIERKLATKTLVQELCSAGKQVFVWTVNRQKEMLRLAELGVDGLISDDTLLLGRTFHEK